MMRVKYIELMGAQHPLCYSLRASAEIGEMIEELENGKRKKGADGLYYGEMLDALLKAGRVYGKVTGIELPPPLPCSAADLIDATDLATIRLIRECIRGGSKREVVTEGNAEATQGEKRPLRGSPITAPEQVCQQQRCGLFRWAWCATR